ncbi:dipeptide epimerase [Sulfurimonas sp. HSL-3221]|uniref:dipeptide epimerase n=1 Tax=Sulfurimonadaceae TaxID=2771471 RepID=UPI001E36D5E4|nr:dipeptide epimerase [Sulfurimonas sp. HSL-3221]UFS62085.1 dipeptide epimerase [Sulfurimonas sp. HSL-3221]
MTISSTRVYRASIPLATPFVTALRRVEDVTFVVLELHMDNGARAYGSAPATKAITGETLESIEQALQTSILPLLQGRPFELQALLHTVATSLPGNSSAKAAVDMALHMLAAQCVDLPLYRYLGAKEATPVTTAVTVSLDTPETMRSKATELFACGYDILKVKVGGGDGLDAQRIRGIADALPGAQLLVDANQAWNLQESLAFIDACADLPLALIEQPVPAPELEALRQITALSPFPILADEAVFDAEDARRVLDAGAADLINIKLMKCGGLAGALAILDVCQTYGAQCMLGSMLEGPVSITAALHLATAYPDRFAWIDLDSPLLYRTLPSDLPFSVHGNCYRL